MPYRLLESAAVRRLRHGQVIVHATEGVFGLGCLAFDEEACGRVADLKARSRAKPFIVVVADFAQIDAAIALTKVDIARIMATWPGPETWIFPAAPAAQRWLCSDDRTIAVRVTGQSQFARLCAVAGPMVSTSANPPGCRPAASLLRARHYFGAAIDFYLAGEILTPGRPSRIRDAISGLTVRA